MARDLSDEEVTLCAGIFPAARWCGGVLTEQGSAYRVALSAPDTAGGRAVIRFGRQPSAAAQLARMSRLHPVLADALAPAQIAVPLPLGPVQQSALGPAMALSFVPGVMHPPFRANPGEFSAGGNDPHVTVPALVGLLAGLANVAVPKIAAQLAEPYSYRGPWTDKKVATVAGFVAEYAPELIPACAQVLGAVRGRPAGFGGAAGLVHGDLAGENMRWNGDFSAVTGVLDWDLASVWDPAINLMHLSLWHGPHVVPGVAAALVHRGVLSGAGFDSADGYADRARYWSGVWALENLWHAADRQQQAQASAIGGSGLHRSRTAEPVKPIKPAALRRLFRKLGPRVTEGAAARKRLERLAG